MIVKMKLVASTRIGRTPSRLLGLFLFIVALVGTAFGQAPTFAGNPQHTSVYNATAQPLNGIRWTTPNDKNNTGAFAHYGMPIITAANTVLVPMKTATDGFQVNAFDGQTGNAKYTETTDYILPSHNWIPVYDPCVTSSANGPRLYYPGAGGTVFYVDNADSSTPTTPVRIPFYTTLSNYNANAASYNSTIFIDTPITADANGNIYFGFRVQGTAPAPLSTTQSGYARIDANGVGTWALMTTASGDGAILWDAHNAAPAISNDGSTVYVACRSASTSYYGYLLGLDTTTMATKYKVFVRDPRNNNPGRITDDSTASPMVGPDGDVFFGIMGNPYNGSRGFLLHFSPDLTVTKTPGAFGWDYTPAVVPVSMVPSYHGPSSYLLFCKYNNYAGVNDGDGINKLAILDPNSTQIDPHASAPGLIEMREVQTIIGTTPDVENPTVTNAIREWCINAAAVNPATGCVYFDSEDGHLYSWHLATNSMSQAVTLTAGVGEPYVPTTIGPDGTVYSLNGGNMFAVGTTSNAVIALDSSAPSVTTALVGDLVTLTATVSGNSGAPTGTVTFTSITYNGLNQDPPTTLASNVPLDANGHASVSVSNLPAGGAYLGNHFITATYSGDSTYSTCATTRIQKLHASSTTTSLVSSSGTSSYGQSVTFTATVTPSGADVPTGMVTFFEGNNVLAQVPLDSNGHAAFSTAALLAGAHTLSAAYYSDTENDTSSGTVPQTVTDGSSTQIGVSPNPASFGQTVTFTATISSATQGAGVPTGSVSFTEGATNFGTASVDSGGQASVTNSALSIGNHAITATFTGTGGWGNSSAASATLPINEGTSTGLITSLSPSTFGQSVTFTATVTPTDSGAGVPTGSVAFKDGAATLGTVALDGTGKAIYSTSNLTVGTHSIGATYVGSAGWQTSSATALSQGVQDGTLTVATSSLNPSVSGQSVTFTATVTAMDSGAGIPAGSVTFKDGATTLATVTADGTGKAAYTTSSLGAGSHLISVNFAGSGGWLNSTGSLTQSVQYGTTTGLASSLNPSAFGQTVTFTATVAATDGSAGTPTGFVTFKDGATVLATLAVDGAGKAAYSTSSLTAGLHSIGASFAGTGNWLSSSATNLSQSVKEGTTSAIASSLNPSTFGGLVTFTATITPVDSGAGVPTGTFTFTDGATQLGTAPVDGTGKAVLVTSNLGGGTHSMGGSFTGSNNWLNSSATPLSQVVQEGTTSALTSSANPATLGLSVTFTATVSAVDSVAGVPSGSVVFSDGATILATVAVGANGKATFTTSALAMGSHTISAAFTGAGGWLNSSATNLTQLIQDSTTTQLTSSRNPSVTGQSVTFTATVVPVAPGSVPVGSVKFTDGATVLATVAVDGTGVATYTTSTLSVASHSIGAAFTGTTGWLSSTGSLTQTVTADTTAPTVPTGVVATSGPNLKQITVTWTASTDPDSPVSGYEVWRATSLNGTYSLAATVTTTSFTDNLSKRGLVRYYYVKSKDPAGNRSAPSAKVSATAK